MWIVLMISTAGSTARDNHVQHVSPALDGPKQLLLRKLRHRNVYSVSGSSRLYVRSQVHKDIEFPAAVASPFPPKL